MQGKKKKKPGRNYGGLATLLEQYQQPLEQGAVFTEQIADTGSTAGTVGGGIAKGAAAGASAGPVGMLAGAVMGAGTGLLQRQKQKAALKLQNKQIALENTKDAFTFKKGGKLSSKLKVLKGGNLSQISPDAVEVNANDPTLTDSVELEQAFVDNNEIIDNKNRVFSDDLKAPSGISIAREAKKLEKQKSKSSRFNEANKRIDDKLDALFQYQEGLKKPKQALQNGGAIVVQPGLADKLYDEYDKEAAARLTTQYGPGFSFTDPKQVYLGFKDNAIVPEMLVKSKTLSPSSNYGKVYSVNDPQLSTDRASMEWLRKTGHLPKDNMKKGGKLSKPKKALGGDEDSWLYTGGGNIESLRPEVETEQQKFDLQPLLTTAATFGPNITNALMQRKLKGPQEPILENNTQLKRVSPRAQLAGANRAYNQAKEVIGSNTGQASNLASATGNLLSKRLAAENQIYGQNQQINAQIANQEAFLNQATNARNTERTNRFRDDEVNFKNKKLQLTSENVSNLGTKILQLGREKNQMKKDAETLKFLEAGYGDSEVLIRMSPELMETLAKYRKQGKSRGGKLNKNK